MDRWRSYRSIAGEAVAWAEPQLLPSAPAPCRRCCSSLACRCRLACTLLCCGVSASLIEAACSSASVSEGPHRHCCGPALSALGLHVLCDRGTSACISSLLLCPRESCGIAGLSGQPPCSLFASVSIPHLWVARPIGRLRPGHAVAPLQAPATRLPPPPLLLARPTLRLLPILHLPPPPRRVSVEEPLTRSVSNRSEVELSDTPLSGGSPVHGAAAPPFGGTHKHSSGSFGAASRQPGAATIDEGEEPSGSHAGSPGAGSPRREVRRGVGVELGEFLAQRGRRPCYNYCCCECVLRHHRRRCPLPLLPLTLHP